MSDFAFTYSPTDTQLRNFYEERKNVVWHIFVVFEGGNNSSAGTAFYSSSGTAFALDASGILMTCAHVFTNKHNKYPEKLDKIYARRLDTEYYEAKMLEINKEWDMALIQVNRLENCNYTRLSDNGNLSVDQILVHIGHTKSLLYSCLVGRVACECVDSPPIPTGKPPIPTAKLDKSNYPPTPIKRAYRILGDDWSNWLSQSLKERKVEGELLFDKIDYRLPIVVTYTLGAKTGSSGGPLFDGKGDVVGMINRVVGSYSISSHVSVLRVFFDKWKRKVADQVGGSGQPKRKSGKISSAAGLEA